MNAFRVLPPTLERRTLMSTHYSPHLIVGVPARELYSAEIRKETKTKYNEK